MIYFSVYVTFWRLFSPLAMHFHYLHAHCTSALLALFFRWYFSRCACISAREKGDFLFAVNSLSCDLTYFHAFWSKVPCRVSPTRSRSAITLYVPESSRTWPSFLTPSITPLLHWIHAESSGHMSRCTLIFSNAHFAAVLVHCICSSKVNVLFLLGKECTTILSCYLHDMHSPNFSH
jgi:hypothetical protein